LKRLVVGEKPKSIIAAIVAISSFLILWHVGTDGTKLGMLLPGPVTVLNKFIQSFYTKIGPYMLWGHILWSLSRVMIAFTIASVSGIILGLVMGWFKKAEAIARPLFEIIRPIPPIAWISLAVLWFGLGETPKYFIIFMSGFANITMNVYTGAKSVDPVLVGASRMLGSNSRQVFTTIVIPSSIPYIFTGLQIAISSSWAAVVAAEMIRSTEGVGWLIISGTSINDTTQILVGILSIGIVGFILATIMRRVEEGLCEWNKVES
jgi:ABC-type nitrate/sulfonate/bicarbonate transport system permease component